MGIPARLWGCHVSYDLHSILAGRGVNRFSACRVQTDVDHVSKQCRDGVLCRCFNGQAVFHKDYSSTRAAGRHPQHVFATPNNMAWLDWTCRTTDVVAHSIGRYDYTPERRKDEKEGGVQWCTTIFPNWGGGQVACSLSETRCSFWRLLQEGCSLWCYM